MPVNLSILHCSKQLNKIFEVDGLYQNKVVPVNLSILHCSKQLNKKTARNRTTLSAQHLHNIATSLAITTKTLDVTAYGTGIQVLYLRISF